MQQLAFSDRMCMGKRLPGAMMPLWARSQHVWENSGDKQLESLTTRSPVLVVGLGLISTEGTQFIVPTSPLFGSSSLHSDYEASFETAYGYG